MTLSPRSFKSFGRPLDDNAKPSGWWTSTLSCSSGSSSKTSWTRAMLFTVLFITSTIIYVHLTMNIEGPPSVPSSLSSDTTSQSQALPFHSLSPTQALPHAAEEWTKHWLLRQSEVMTNSEQKRSSQSSLPPLLSDSFDAFAAGSGVNIWDLYPPTINCPDMLRLGQVGEGGKWICGLSHIQSLSECVMYSFGISTDMSFEMEILLHSQCVIYAFDPTIGELPYSNLPIHLNKSLTDELKKRIIFHKIALGVTSGSSSSHILNEAFYDIMTRFNHSFIHLVKMDIEGGEWDVFQELSTSTILPRKWPVGQLLIELHHQTSSQTSHFFHYLHSIGFYPFSREINLIPCLSGGKPFAVEYSFVHPSQFYHDDQLYRHAPPTPATPSWHTPIQAIIYYLSMHKRVGRLTKALHSLYTNYWQFYPYYTVVIFHDDFTTKDLSDIIQTVPRMMIKFVQVSFTIPESLLRKKIEIPERTVCDPQFSTIGYRHMCRFHAWMVHNELEELGIEYEYLMRLDDDSIFSQPIGYDWFRLMLTNNKKYGYVNTVEDNVDCVVNLWDHARRGFVNQSNIQSLLRDDNFLQEWPDPMVFYNNFEISHVSIWKSVLWKKFINYIDDIGGIYTLRWGDAPLHTIGVSMLLSKRELHAFTDISYQHSPFLDQKPRGLPMPGIDPFSYAMVECSYYDRWICGNSTQNSTSTSNASITTASSSSSSSSSSSLHHSLTYLKERAKQQQQQQSQTGAAAVVYHSQDQYNALVKKEKAVLYSFGHEGREHLLLETILNLFQNYAFSFPTVFIIFYNQNGSFKIDQIEQGLRLRSSDLHQLIPRPVIRFIPVSLDKLTLLLSSTTSTRLDPYCSCQDMEVQSASIFLRFEAFTILSSLGYEWFLRFGDDSKLLYPIGYHLFHRMKIEKKVFGYIETISGRLECSLPVWEIAKRLCSSTTTATTTTIGQQSSSSSSSSSCSALFHEWRPEMVFMTALEVSHISLWQSNFAKAMINEIEKHNHTALGALDSIVHTVIVVGSLTSDQLLQLEDLHFHYEWNHKAGSQIIDHRIHIKDYHVMEVQALDEAFAPQRLGWLGGDVATSILLPLPTTTTTTTTWNAIHGNGSVDSMKKGKKLIWLFGDSILGMSTAERRIGDYSSVVANTIGISTISSSSQCSPSLTSPAGVSTSSSSSSSSSSTSPLADVQDIKYYWRIAKDGSPKAIFHPTESILCRDPQVQPVIWPIAGLAITGEKISENRLVILAQVSCGHNPQKDNLHTMMSKKALDFVAEQTMLIIVKNPYDDPDQWHYDQTVFPTVTTSTSSSSSLSVHWMAMSPSHGRRVAHMTDLLYLVGAYRPASQQHVSSGGYQILGRISVQSLLGADFSQLEVFLEDEQWHPFYSIHTIAANQTTTTTNTISLPRSLFGPVVSEISFFYHFHKHQWQTVSLRLLDRYIESCHAENVTGPWTCQYIAEVPSRWQHSRLLSYAAKMHPDLLASSSSSCQSFLGLKSNNKKKWQVVISFVSNTVSGPAALFESNNRAVYSPKFLFLESSRTVT